MQELNMWESEAVSGAGIWSYLGRKAAEGIVAYVSQLAIEGQIDYAGLAESQGTYYNTVGA